MISKMHRMLCLVMAAVLVALIQAQRFHLSILKETRNYALIGQNLTFNCEIDGGGVINTVFFEKNGKRVCIVNINSCVQGPSHRYKCGCDANGYITYLKIIGVNETDDAGWTCKSNITSNIVNLTVYGEPNVVNLNASKLGSVREGEDLDSVNCSAECLPACSFTWYKDTTATVIPSINGVLSLKDLPRTATGRYFCVATHPKLDSSTTSPKLDLDVYFGPDPVQINQTHGVTMLEGETMAPIRCYSNCNPPCSSEWFQDQIKPSNLIPSVDGLLNITNVNRKQSGRYFCRAFHEMYSLYSEFIAVDIDVQYPPDRVSITPTKLNPVFEGDDVEVECTVNCNPTCTLSWIKDDGSEIASHGGILALMNINRTQSGSYTCQAGYTVTGFTLNSSPININVFYPPDRVNLTLNKHDQVFEGDTVRVKCTAECKPDCRLSWFKDASSYIPSQHGVLVLNNTDRTQSGRYTCQVGYPNTGITLRSSPIDINVYYPPERVVITPTKLHPVLEGEDVAVECSVNCNPKCTLSWIKDDGSEIASQSGVLALNDINRTQSGNYTCQAGYTVTGFTLNSSTININVYYAPDSVNLTPNKNDQVFEGDTVRVKCTAECKPDCRLSWFKDASSYIPSQNGVLVLNNTDRTQSGRYICQVGYPNTGITLSSSIDINVYYPPERVDITPTKLHPVLEGVDVAVECTVNCNPTCTLSWIKDDGSEIASQGGVLALHDINRTQSGNYTCQAGYTVTGFTLNSSTININVYYGPDHVLFNQTTLIEVIEGETLGPVSCRADCNPSCSISWHREPTIFITNTNLLLVENINQSDSGSYYCLAYNQLTEVRHKSKMVDIDVYYGPMNIALSPANLQSVVEGGNISLTCSAECYPTCNYEWYKRTANDSNYLLEESGRLSVLNINRTEVGTYICTATNPKSPTLQQNVNVIIDVIFPPILSTSYSEFDRDKTNVTMYMYCEVVSNPPATISWYRDDDDDDDSIGIGNNYTVLDTACDDQRNYTCVADNGVGSPVSKQFSLYTPCSTVVTPPNQTTYVYSNTTSSVQTVTNSSISATNNNISVDISLLSKTLIGVVCCFTVLVVILILLFVLWKRRNTGHKRNNESTERPKRCFINNPICDRNCVQNPMFGGSGLTGVSLSMFDNTSTSTDVQYNRASGSDTDVKEVVHKSLHRKPHEYTLVEGNSNVIEESVSGSRPTESREAVDIITLQAEVHKRQNTMPRLSSDQRASRSALPHDDSVPSSGSSNISAETYKITEMSNQKYPPTVPKTRRHSLQHC